LADGNGGDGELGRRVDGAGRRPVDVRWLEICTSAARWTTVGAPTSSKSPASPLRCRVVGQALGEVAGEAGGGGEKGREVWVVGVRGEGGVEGGAGDGEGIALVGARPWG
jgi:hypothetical protein